MELLQNISRGSENIIRVKAIQTVDEWKLIVSEGKMVGVIFMDLINIHLKRDLRQ